MNDIFEKIIEQTIEKTIVKLVEEKKKRGKVAYDKVEKSIH